MKILQIDYNFYYFPKNMSCIAEFIEYVNKNYNSFIELTRFETDNCVFPYLIKEETDQFYINIATMASVKEVDATVLCRAEYDARLEQVVKKKCVDCVYYEEDMEGDNLTGHREKLSLDGECFGYRKNKSKK